MSIWSVLIFVNVVAKEPSIAFWDSLTFSFIDSSYDALWRYNRGPYANDTMVLDILSGWKQGDWLLETCIGRDLPFDSCALHLVVHQFLHLLGTSNVL